ncbi:MAG: DUF2752 domain-containing protein [Deltaproteobacteria bacterium]|nr:DUF2752 domain-containing protein [Deltaproteobacteria bacterium]
MLRFERPTKPTLGLLEIYGAMGVALLVTARFVPLARLPFWGCALRKHTGIPCLSCGMTRSFDWFMQGRLLDSLLVNPLGFTLAALSVVGAAYLVLWKLRPPRLRVELSVRAGSWVRWSALVLIAANWGYLITRALLSRS